jgi:hypothetical protein
VIEIKKLNKKQKKMWMIIGVIAIIATLGFLAYTNLKPKPTPILSVNNNMQLLGIPIHQTASIASNSCTKDADCGLNGCSQQGTKGDICNYKRYTCEQGQCKTTESLFEHSYCTPSGCKETCGDFACEVDFGETDKNCPSDCTNKGIVFP